MWMHGTWTMTDFVCYKYLPALVIITIISSVAVAQTPTQNDLDDDSVCYLDTTPVSSYNLAVGSRLELRCRCYVVFERFSINPFEWTLDQSSLRQRIQTDDDVQVQNDWRDYDASSTLTLTNVAPWIGGHLCCMMSTNITQSKKCVTIKVNRRTFTKVGMTVTPQSGVEGNVTNTALRWLVLINCTVQTDSEYVRDNANFLLEVNGNHSRAFYTNTSKWEVMHINTTRYLKRNEFEIGLALGSIVVCYLQDFDGISFGPEGTATTTFLPLALSPQTTVSTSTTSGYSSTTVHSTIAGTVENPEGYYYVIVAAVLGSISAVVVVVGLLVLVIALILQRRRSRRTDQPTLQRAGSRTESLTDHGSEPASKEQVKELGITVEKKFAEVMDQIEELAGQNRIVGDES